MSRLAACPKCRNQFTLPELSGPATIACPFCGAHINIKVKGPAVPPPAMVVQPAMAVARAMPVDDDDDEEEEEEEEVRPKKKKKKKGKASASANTGGSETGMKIAIVGGILLLTLISIVFAFWWFLKGDNTPKIILPNQTFPANSALDPDGDEEVAEATGAEKFEIPDKNLVHSDLFRSIHPNGNLPGLQTDTIKESNDSLGAKVLDRVKGATVYIETTSDDGGGTGSGFFACEKGLVITNAHVISMLDEGSSEPKSVRVFLNHGKSNQQDYKVTSFKVDRKNDLAILRLPRAYESSYPEPLTLASSLTTRETQKVFSLGFPYGNSAGKEVTVTAMTVSSLRFQNNRINTVQFAGNLNPGNSGGPIVDAMGRVVSVAVRIYTERSGEGMSNTGISFGVPCDEVSALHHGRADRIDLYPPTRLGSLLKLPIVLRMTEHASRKASPRIKITPGEEKTPPSKPEKSDSAEQLNASETKQLYTGSIELPEIDSGKVYWLQPQLTLGENEVNWLEPISYKPEKVLDDRTLPTASGSESKGGEFKFQQRYEWNINARTGSYSTRIDYAATTQGAQQALKDLHVGAKINDRSLPHQYLQQYWSTRIPDDEVYSRNGLKLTTALKSNLNQWHDLSQLNVPTETIKPGKSWKLSARPVVMDYLVGFDANQQCSMTCEYLGAYTDNSRLIGVIRIQGDVSDISMKGTPYAKVAGLALIDGTSRQLIDLMIRCDARKRATGGNSRLGSSPSIDGTMQLRLQRKDS